MSESRDRRFLGGISFVDVNTTDPVRGPLVVRCSSARFFRNRSGYYVIDAADGLEDHLDAFAAAPGAPAGGPLSFEAEVHDPELAYLPRRFGFTLPRPSSASGAGSAFDPIVVQLYPSVCATNAANAAEVSASLVLQATGVAAPNALARVVRVSDGEVLGRGMSMPLADGLTGRPIRAVGEILVFVPGALSTISTSSSGPPELPEVDVRFEVIPGPPGALPDPDALAALAVHPGNRSPTFALRTRGRKAFGAFSLTV